MTPLEPAPPTTFEITTSTPAASANAPTKPLAIVSVPPPAFHGTISLIVLSGKPATVSYTHLTLPTKRIV